MMNYVFRQLAWAVQEIITCAVISENVQQQCNKCVNSAICHSVTDTAVMQLLEMLTTNPSAPIAFGTHKFELFKLNQKNE